MSAIEQAAHEAAEAVGAIHARRHFTISRFGRHRDGYLHARVIVDGRPWYFHHRFGSWLVPGHMSRRSVLKEAEAVLGSAIGREVKYALAEKARAYRRAEIKQEANDGTRTDDSAGSGDRLPTGADHRDADDAVLDA